MSHTIIVALAVTISDDGAPCFPAFESLPDVDAEHVSVVGVLDRGNPSNNFEPQIFASWPAEQARETVEKFSATGGMEHGP